MVSNHFGGHSNKETRNFHVRQLFYRVKRLLALKARPIFVLDGAAPEAKLATIAARLGVKKVKSNARSFLRSQFAPCCRLLDAMGVTWVQAPAEAEKLAAALNMAGLVDAVVSQDGDSVCFGARRVYRSFSSEANTEIELLSMSNVETELSLSRFDFITCAILLGCDFFPGGIKGLGPVQAEKIIKEWKSQKRNPIQHLAKIKSGQRKEKHSKLEDKLFKLMAGYEEMDPIKLAKEFQVTFEDSFLNSLIKKPSEPNIASMTAILTRDLEWPKEKALERSILFAFETGHGVSGITLNEFVRRLRGGNKYEVKLSVGPLHSAKMTIERTTLMRHYAAQVETYHSSLSKKPPTKKSGKENRPISDFLTKEKRKLNSPHRAPNPSLAKKLLLKNEAPNFSIGIDDLCEGLNESVTIDDDEDDYVPLSIKAKMTSKNIPNKS